MNGLLKLSAAALFIALLAAGTPARAQQWADFTASDGSFTVSMPGKPEEKRETGTHYNLPSQSLFYTAKSSKVFFVFAARTDYHPDAVFTARSELEDNRNNFADGVKGKVISERFFKFVRGPDDVLDALDVTTENDNGVFRQLYVVAGNRVYGLIAGARRGEGQADVSAFLNSLRINRK